MKNDSTFIGIFIKASEGDACTVLKGHRIILVPHQLGGFSDCPPTEAKGLPDGTPGAMGQILTILYPQASRKSHQGDISELAGSLLTGEGSHFIILGIKIQFHCALQR